MGSQGLVRVERENLNLDPGHEKEGAAPQRLRNLIFASIPGFRRKPRLAPPQRAEGTGRGKQEAGLWLSSARLRDALRALRL